MSEIGPKAAPRGTRACGIPNRTAARPASSRFLDAGNSAHFHVFATGGIGKDIGVTRRIERLIGVEAVKLPSDSVLDPQIAGALGAALFAHSLYRKAQKEGGASEPAKAPGVTGRGA